MQQTLEQNQASVTRFIWSIVLSILFGSTLFLNLNSGEFSYWDLLYAFLLITSIKSIYSNWFILSNKHWKMKPVFVFILTVLVTLFAFTLYVIGIIKSEDNNCNCGIILERHYSGYEQMGTATLENNCSGNTGEFVVTVESWNEDTQVESEFCFNEGDSW